MIDKAASLTGALLVRKGTARPTVSTTTLVKKVTADVISLSALKGMATPAPKGIAPITPIASGGKRIRVSLRLDKKRHQVLKKAATQGHVTMQSLFVAALDEYLADYVDNLDSAVKVISENTK